jgi:signal transduction histidine kinase
MLPAHPQFPRLGVGARIFGFVLLSVPLLWSREDTSLLALLTIGIIWAAAVAAERLRLNSLLSSIVEAALVGAVCGLTLEAAPAVLGALAVPPFVASLRRGPRGMVLALSAELVALVAIAVLTHGALNPAQGSGTVTWVVTGIGVGLIGSFVHSAMPPPHDPLQPYRDAQALIRDLIGISGELTSGLDPVSLGTTIADAVRDELPVTALVVQVPRNDELTPLVVDADSAETDTGVLHDLALATRRTNRPAVSGNAFALPLLSDWRMVAVVSGTVSSRLESKVMNLEARLDEVAERLAATAVHLETAMLFASFRDAATVQERRRLAREMHDGIAQDIASLGYVVDGLAAGSESPEQAAGLRALRERITAVVTEVRRSVRTLRTDVDGSESLGTAIGGLARHLSESSGIPIQVTAEERTARLRPEVESELLRIAQESMNNAVRHARPSLVEVRCSVEAPGAEIVVQDDGTGMGIGRPDSWGLEIMRERALLIGAELTIEDAQPHGTRVRVRVPAPHITGRPGVVRDEEGVNA